jgi:multimeric flavodoxin WrbA
MKLGHCVGCFGCWLKTPGICVENDDGRKIAKEIIRSDVTVMFSKLAFGCYSPELKNIIDRIISPLLQPFMEISNGETHHIPRYPCYPRLIGVGVQHCPDDEEQEIFKFLVGRNALNLHAPSYAAEIVQGNAESEALRQSFEAMLVRNDTFPLRTATRSFMPVLAPAQAIAGDHDARRALLIMGSPKAKPSTSASLGSYWLECFERRGWETETLRLKANLKGQKGQAELLAAVDRTSLILLSFPLYNDSLPVFVIKALEVIAVHRRMLPARSRQRLAVICNNGFPEAHHNIPAVAICRKFAIQTGIDWAGCLALGAGEALSGGVPLQNRKGLPSVKHVMRALDLASAALDEGQPVPDKSVRMIARNPIPLAPFSIWRGIFIRKAGKRWQMEAAENNVNNARLLAQPFLNEETVV